MKTFKNNGKLKLLIIVGTRPEIIRLAAVINKCRKYFDCLLAHTGQNYDYNLNGVFFKDLKLEDPDIYMEAVGADLGETMGNIIASSYKVMVETKPDAVLVAGDIIDISVKPLITDSMAVCELLIHFSAGSPIIPSMAFAKPSSGWNIHVHTIEIATVGVIHGEKSINSMIPLPLKFF